MHHKICWSVWCPVHLVRLCSYVLQSLLSLSSVWVVRCSAYWLAWIWLLAGDFCLKVLPTGSQSICPFLLRGSFTRAMLWPIYFLGEESYFQAWLPSFSLCFYHCIHLRQVMMEGVWIYTTHGMWNQRGSKKGPSTFFWHSPLGQLS